MPSRTDPSHEPSHHRRLDVRGAVPPGLCGRLVGIGRDGIVHSVHACDGRVSYGSRSIRTEAVVHHLVAFGGSLLAFGDDSLAYELRPEAGTLRRVDLAGQGRSLGAYPKHDPATGELHLLAHDTDGVQAHVVVSAGALTRHSSLLFDTPARIQDLALSRDSVVLVAEGFVGVTPRDGIPRYGTQRDGTPRTTWIATGGAAPHPVHAFDADDTVVMIVLTPLLERWTLNPGAGSMRREVLDPTPRRFARCGTEDADGTLQCLWTTGGGAIDLHQLVDGRHVHHDLRPDEPGDLVFVADATRASALDGGWLVGFVRDGSSAATELRVIDAADIGGPAIAAAPVPRHVPSGLRCTWIPSTQQ